MVMENPGLTGLLEWWDLDETDGTRLGRRFGDALNDNNTVLVTSGIKNNAAHFIGLNNEYLSLVAKPDISMRDQHLTWVGFFKADDLSLAYVFLAKYGDSAGNNEYFLRRDPGTGEFHFAVYDGTSFIASVKDVVIQQYMWYMVAIYHSPVDDEIGMSINAQPFVTSSTGGTDPGLTVVDFTLGAWDGPLNTLHGSADILSLWHTRVLSIGNLEWLYNSGAGRNYWELDPPPPQSVSPILVDSLTKADWEILVLDSGRNTLGVIDRYDQLDVSLKYNDISPWHLRVTAGTPEATLLAFGNRIRVLRNEAEVLEGPIKKIDRRWNKEDDAIFFSGVDNVGYLADRLITPVPSGPPYSSAEADVNTGAATDVIKQYVRDHAATSAIMARQILDLTVAADDAVGGTITGRPRFKNLLKTLIDLALIGGDLQFTILDMVFDAFEPPDDSAQVIFSPELGNVQSFTYQQVSPKANFIIGGGGGEGTDRLLVETGDPYSELTYGRIEWFYDRRNISDAAELQEAIIGHLEEKAASLAIKLKPILLPKMDFQTAWNLGSLVTVVIDSIERVEKIREVVIKLSGAEGEHIEPVISSARAETISPMSRIYASIQDTNSRVEDLDRSY